MLSDGANAYFGPDGSRQAPGSCKRYQRRASSHDHHPDIDVRHDGVTVRLITFADDYGGMTLRDAEMARRISAAARELSLPADPSAVQSLLVIPGATVRADVMPFWRAALGYEIDIATTRGRG